MPPRSAVPPELADADSSPPSAFPGTSTGASKQNMSTDPKADSLVAEAEKKLKGFSLFSGSQKYEEAVEKLVKAAVSFFLHAGCSWLCLKFQSINITLILTILYTINNAILLCLCLYV